MNLENNIAIESFISKGKTNSESIEKNTKETLEYLKQKYINDEILNEAFRFADLLFLDTFKSDIEALKRIGFYSSTEAQFELEFSIKSLLTGNYKNSADHMRRALELVIATIYFSLDNVEFSVAREWMDSKEGIPSFSGKMIRKLISEKRFKDINGQYNWSEDIKSLYWDLCDYIHVKGQNKGFRILNLGNTSSTRGNTIFPINEDTIDEFILLYKKTIQSILTALYLYNPVLLIGLPIEEKYGSSAPTSGFFNDCQAECMKKLIPHKYKEFFIDLAKTDTEIIETRKKVLDLPDIPYIY